MQDLDLIDRLLPTSRFYPMHFHVIRSLLRITNRTDTFIPLAAPLIAMLSCPEFKRKPKPSTQLKPLDFEYVVRVPTSYLKTRTLADGLSEEVAFALLEYFAAHSKSIAFPEVVLPAMITIKRFVKASSSPKLVSALKSLLEKLEANRTYIEKHRSQVEFAPNNLDAVRAFLRGSTEETPLTAMLRRETKSRAQRRELLEKNAGPDEME